VYRNLVAMLVQSSPTPAAGRTDGDRGRVAPPTLRRAIRYIEDHAADDIGLADIAAAAGLGARGLQLAFRRHHDVTPLEYLRRVRLDRAHHDLQAGTPADATVGRIADRWGFPHHGNFSALYLRTYGCSPSMTLRS
jgi:transcriptional regulator GlxA family with amidase domain